MEGKTIIIIGGGFAGLSAGIYAQMNGYRTQIFEMAGLPGGLCTAWKRGGYTIDGCIHWLVGSSPKSQLYQFWQEVGVLPGREIINLEAYECFEGADGRTLTLYCDVNRLEKHLLEFSPQDAPLIRKFIHGIRLCLALDEPAPPGRLGRLMRNLKMGLLFARRGRELQTWMQTTAEDFASRFKDPLIRTAFKEMWFPEFSMLFMLYTFAYLHKQDAGYPIGGSLPMSRALEKRYLELGGRIHYHCRVEKILVENDCAVGVRLADGSEHRANRVISAADGHATIFEMLEGKYADEKVREPYEKWQVFPGLLYVGLGVKRTFEEAPKTVAGLSFPLKEAVELGSEVVERLRVHLFHHDPTLAPPGKTSVVVMLPNRYDYWKELAQDRAAYDEKKEQIKRTVVSLLEQRFPGIGADVEMVDVSTPLTFERYTGNWQGSFEGWLLTPQNAQVMLKPMSQTLPGLQRFYLCGQWVEPGGGLPTAVMSARRLLQAICQEDGEKFTARTA